MCVIYYGVAVFQCVNVSGVTCNVLVEFKQLMAEVMFIKITQNDKNRVWILLLCADNLNNQVKSGWCPVHLSTKVII